MGKVNEFLGDVAQSVSEQMSLILDEPYTWQMAWNVVEVNQDLIWGTVEHPAFSADVPIDKIVEVCARRLVEELV